jgi:hypothetical protein
MTLSSRRESTQSAYEPYFIAAILAAQFQFQKKGFRQKDVRFLIELFTNWMESTLGEVTLPLQNVQISRYLTHLCKNDIAKKLRGKNPPNRAVTFVLRGTSFHECGALFMEISEKKNTVIRFE